MPARRQGSTSSTWGTRSRKLSGALARSDFSEIPRYTSSDDFEVNLADNTNLWGTPPAAAAALRASGDAAQYPDIYGDSLKHTVAAKNGISRTAALKSLIGGEEPAKSEARKPLPAL